MGTEESTMKPIYKEIRKTGKHSISSLFKNSRFRQKTKKIPEEELKLLKEKTKLEENQIVEHYENFLEKHPNGTISKKAFNELLSECFTKSSRKRIQDHLWRIYDLNMDGVVDFNEFLTVLQVMSHGTPEQNLKQIFRFFDVNMNGFIEKLEMDQVVRDLLEVDSITHSNSSVIAEGAYLEMAEAERSGVSEEEFTVACLSNKQNTSMITKKVISLFLDQ